MSQLQDSSVLNIGILRLNVYIGPYFLEEVRIKDIKLVKIPFGKPL